jgi:ABC-type Fe3+/spermidine/putrescine transport system ATPase subunit
MTPLLQVENLGHAFGTHRVFQDVSFNLHAGQHLAVLGPSGCGKSTLLRVLAGLDAPAEGSILLDGKLVSGPGRIVVAPHERKLAMVFQDLALWPGLTARENVILGLAQAGLSRNERNKRAVEALTTCKIGELAERKPEKLSIGQQQRVALARAIAIRPQLLLLDEPFSSLDLPLKQELMLELVQLTGQSKITMLLVSHDSIEAKGLCSQVLVLEDGDILERGTWNELMANPASKTLRAFSQVV